MAAHDPGGRSKRPWRPDAKVLRPHFSPCEKFRYNLEEVWDPTRPSVMFLLMNPSVATEEFADPTLMKTGFFARAWGYGSQLIGNVHAYRATDNGELLLQADPVGPENDKALLEMAGRAELVVLAFGLPPKPLRARGRDVIKILATSGANLHYLRLTKDGTPGHPFYLPRSLEPIPYPVIEV